MRVAVLGSPALVGAALTAVRGAKQAGLLSLLVTNAGTVVRREVLEDQLWEGRRVSDSALRVTASRLREQFREVVGEDPIVGDRTGFRLELEPTLIDAVAYERLVAEADRLRWTGDARRAAALVDDAEALWRGPAYDGTFDLPAVRAEHERLERLRAGVLEQTAADLVVLGDQARAVELAGLIVERHPYRETAWALRLAGLHQQGRSAEAVQEYERLRGILAAELGIDPSPALRALLSGITGGGGVAEAIEPVLADLAPTPPERLTVTTAPSGPPASPFVGRSRELRSIVEGFESATTWVVEGAAGMGKTRLAAEVARTLEERGWTVVTVGCSRGGGGGLEPIAELVDRLLAGIDLPLRAPYEPLHALAPARFDGHLPRWIDPDLELRRLAITLSAERLLRDTATAPTLLVVDDVHWLGAAGGAILTHLHGHGGEVRWLLLSREAERTPAANGFLADLPRGGEVGWTRLGPMEDGELGELVTLLAGDAGPWVDDVVRRCGGSPLLASDLVRHRSAGGAGDDVPSSVAATVAATVATLDASAIAVARAVVVAGRTVPLATLAEVTELTEDDAEAAVSDAVAAGLLVAREDGIAAGHDLLAQALHDQIDAGALRRLHRRWSRATSRRPREVQHALEHLLAAGDAEADELDEVAAPALRSMLARGAVAEGSSLARAYVEAVGSAPSTRAGIEARVQAAGLLLTVDARRGRALYDAVWPQVQGLGDPLLLADALLARGPIDLGSPNRAHEVAIASDLLARLPRDEVARRVQVATWAAHHLIGMGDGEGAERMLDAADAELVRRPTEQLQGLVLGIRAQGTLVATSSPARAQAGHDAIAAFAEVTGDAGSLVMAAVLDVDRQLRDGGRADVVAAIDHLESLTADFPRQDVVWWVAATRAMVALGTADDAEIERRLATTEAVGNRIRLAIGPTVSMAQRLFQRWFRGDLHELRPVFALPDPTVDTGLLLGAGLVTLADDDLEAARTVAASAAERAPLLAPNGNVWAVFATWAAELAFRTGHAGLGRSVAEELAPWAGTGLSGSGLLHGGAADRAIGQCLVAAGTVEEGADALLAGFTHDRDRGWTRWAARAAQDAASVLDRLGGRRGDETSASLRAEAARLTSSNGSAPV